MGSVADTKGVSLTILYHIDSLIFLLLVLKSETISGFSDILSIQSIFLFHICNPLIHSLQLNSLPTFFYLFQLQ